MAASNPLQLTSDTGALSLAVRSFGGNVYLTSAVPVSIDLGVAANVNGINTQTGGSTVCGSGPCYGEVFLTAAGSITQTYGIQSGILTLSTADPVPRLPSPIPAVQPAADPGNTVFGQVHLYTSRQRRLFVRFCQQYGGQSGRLHGDGQPHRHLKQWRSQCAGPQWRHVNVGGTTTLTAGTGSGIFIQTPLISGSNLSLIADQDINQSSGISDSHIQTGGALFVQSSSGSISLNDLGCCGGSSCGGDFGNQVGGIAVFNAAGDVVFERFVLPDIGQRDRRQWWKDQDLEWRQPHHRERRGADLQSSLRLRHPVVGGGQFHQRCGRQCFGHAQRHQLGDLLRRAGR